MAFTATIGSMVVGAAGVHQSYKQGKAQSAAQKAAAAESKRLSDQAVAKSEKDSRLLAESTPFKSMDATKRIQLERMMAQRQTGGRASTVMGKNSSQLG